MLIKQNEHKILTMNMATTSINKEHGRKKIKISKNKKKSWSKVCNITEIEEYLEEKRFEERIGGRIADKKDDELFFLQTSHKEPINVINKKFNKKPLRCHQNIGVYSKVPTPIDPDQIGYSKRIKKALSNAEKKKLKVITRKLSLRQQKIPTVKNNKGSLIIKEFTTDLWGEEPEKDPEIRDLINYRDEITKKKAPKVPCHRYQKPSLLPSVEFPHAGASYNPSAKDHQELIGEAVQIELKKGKEEMHLKRVLDDMFPTRAKAPTNESMLEEMAQGLFDEETEEDIDSKNLRLSTNPPVSRDNRVTRSRKNRIKVTKEQARLKELEKLNKKRLNEIYRLQSIKSEIRAQEELTKERYAKRQKKEAEKLYQPHKLSKHKYEPNDLEVNLSEDIRGSLRVVKTEGNLLEDRYKSLQRRNIIEPRVPQKFKRKYKLKIQVKRGHRNFE